MAQNIALSALYLTDFDMLASMSFLLQFIALAQSLKTLAGSLSEYRTSNISSRCNESSHKMQDLVY